MKFSSAIVFCRLWLFLPLLLISASSCESRTTHLGQAAHEHVVLKASGRLGANKWTSSVAGSPKTKYLPFKERILADGKEMANWHIPKDRALIMTDILVMYKLVDVAEGCNIKKSLGLPVISGFKLLLNKQPQKPTPNVTHPIFHVGVDDYMPFGREVVSFYSLTSGFVVATEMSDPDVLPDPNWGFRLLIGNVDTICSPYLEVFVESFLYGYLAPDE